MDEKMKVAVLPVVVVSVVLIGAVLGVWVSISGKPKRLRVKWRWPVVRHD